jgi:2-polyprenyl-3-methyl-5-hydroxy-6-metoxy-1,4-benzoquinol methylase
LLISPEYLELQRELHSRGNYGVSALRWADAVNELACAHRCRTVLDYGCGRGLLAQALPFHRPYDLYEYDPAIEGKDVPPRGLFDMVFCGDVLEHIEPDLLDDVLGDIRCLAARIVLLVVATRPAKKMLADGRNAHLIVEAFDWWLPRLAARWKTYCAYDDPSQFQFIGVAK